MNIGGEHMDEIPDYVKWNNREINGFIGGYRWLSNYHECPVYYEGIKYPSSENAFMAAKTLLYSERLQFTNISSDEAKVIGRTIKLRPNWNEIRVEVMYAVVFDKFYRNKGLRKWLLATGDKLLVDGNDRNDKFWGVCEGEGENMLGKILMQIRKDFQFINSYGN